MNVTEVLPYLTLALLILNFAFGRGDKSSAKVDAIVARQHQQDLELRAMEANMRDHMGDKFATKTDFERLERTVTQLTDRMVEGNRQNHEALLAVLRPLADQLIVSPVHRG